jgi:sugar lactone lactonase YvrE
VSVQERAATLIVDTACTLGEGIVWDAKRRALFWTDIENSQLWMRVVATGETHSWILPQRAGALAIGRSGRVLLGFEKRLCLIDIDTSTPVPLNIKELAAVEPTRARTRVNDGRTDRNGNFVFGTLNEGEDKARIGSFYQYSMKRGLRRLDLGGVAIPNSICFSPDGRTMYYCDSLERRIMQCDYDADSAHVADEREFVRFAHGDGLPDGSVIDARGCLWNAAWGAGQVRCYGASGSVETVIEVPTQNPTCPAFGGDGYSDVYITSSRQELTTEQLRRTPHAGGVYHCRLNDVVGLPDELFPDT